MKKIKKNQKGFTLVEIIVVLVILAILAAAAIPTMLGFVEDAKGKAEIANARAAYVAAQTIATENHASGTTMTDAQMQTKIVSLTSIDPAPTSITVTQNAAGKVTKLVYVGATHTVTIEPNKPAVVAKN